MITKKKFMKNIHTKKATTAKLHKMHSFSTATWARTWIVLMLAIKLKQTNKNSNKKMRKEMFIVCG